MPLVALITDAVKKVTLLLPQMSAIHLCAATLSEAKTAVFIFTSPESIIDGTGRGLLQTDLNIKAVFIDEFHIVERWYVHLTSTVTLTYYILTLTFSKSDPSAL